MFLNSQMKVEVGAAFQRLISFSSPRALDGDVYLQSGEEL